MTITAQAVQFHVQRLGRRDHVAKLFSVSKETLRDISPRSELERYQSGEMISIGNLLARKCVGCQTAKVLDDFVSKAPNNSGCGNLCNNCRRARTMHKMYLRVRKSK